MSESKDVRSVKPGSFSFCIISSDSLFLLFCLPSFPSVASTFISFFNPRFCFRHPPRFCKKWKLSILATGFFQPNRPLLRLAQSSPHLPPKPLPLVHLLLRVHRHLPTPHRALQPRRSSQSERPQLSGSLQMGSRPGWTKRLFSTTLYPTDVRMELRW
jgi:hypothetical protein